MPTRQSCLPRALATPYRANKVTSLGWRIEAPFALVRRLIERVQSSMHSSDYRVNQDSSILAKYDSLSSPTEATFRTILRSFSSATLCRENNIIVAFHTQACRTLSRFGACAFPVAWLSLSRKSSLGAPLV